VVAVGVHTRVVAVGVLILGGGGDGDGTDVFVGEFIELAVRFFRGSFHLEGVTIGIFVRQTKAEMYQLLSPHCY
jgi:hypothetical protein